MAALGLVSATGPLSTDTYLAALPALRGSLGTTASAAQLTITTCIIRLAILLGVPETSGRRRTSQHSTGQHGAGQNGAEGAPVPEMLRLVPRVRRLFSDRRFTSAVLVQCAATAGFFVYIGGSSFALQEHFGISPVLYAAVFASNAAGMATASLAFSVLAARIRPERLRGIGVLASTSAAAVMLALALATGGAPSVAAVWGCLFVVVTGMGFTQPATTTIAQEAGRWAPGTASSVQGGLVGRSRRAAGALVCSPRR